MGKKKGKKGTGRQSAVQAQSKALGDIHRDSLKPFIRQEIAQLGQGLMNAQANTQNRLLAVERLLELKESEISTTVADIEDEATGHIETLEPAGEGDLLRLSVRTKGKDKEEFEGESQMLLVNDLGKTPFSIGEKLEKSLIGIVKGETRVSDLDEGEMSVEVKADRVSTLKVKPEEPTTEDKAPAKAETVSEKAPIEEVIEEIVQDLEETQDKESLSEEAPVRAVTVSEKVSEEDKEPLSEEEPDA